MIIISLSMDFERKLVVTVVLPQETRASRRRRRGRIDFVVGRTGLAPSPLHRKPPAKGTVFNNNNYRVSARKQNKNNNNYYRRPLFRSLRTGYARRQRV